MLSICALSYLWAPHKATKSLWRKKLLGITVGMQILQLLLYPLAGASTEGKVDATCVQIGLRGEENYTLKGGRIPPDIWVICKCNL